MSGVFEKIVNINERLKLIGVYTGGIAVVIMMFLIVADVFMRNIFTSPISGTYEIVQFFLMPMAIFPALAYTYSSGVLPRLGELVEKAPQSFQKISKWLIIIIEVVIFTLLTIYGWKFAMAGVGDQMAVAVGGKLTPVYPVYFLIPIGFGLIVLEVLLSAIKPLINNKRTN
ncbi:TRAP transporter small permease [Alkalihalobacterium chitinilyticum]|uniref:TRAP transporter small permease n=1 Tax=Alkalihalobacterium chitinilyticum TaxID=2980103 RepID=A0ABT5V9J1_9BACI|nr:TRAP transporter small permease [Alkalihalobacterium chitinilyticum]MDE5412120.1 TRAP transporter small permease [Alkalihalobacterium chitinilyticum]